ncbi:MerR family transcriptional regulator [Desulfatitalea tepidiphila]|uniref:MerR family transcriptional regulator n=1 Tax=Desulfatitalea tepidiphila TaxID=1185843 RepID=UPI0006B44AF0|nr:MerR family transcriptional regulator [Desulfatitalea tepidiphila]
MSIPNDEPTWTVSQLAGEFDISTRTIRFYEEKGLLAPSRTNGGHRLFTKRDRARLKLILRGKRFGFTLEEIADMIGLISDGIDEREQIRRTLRYADRSLREIRQRMAELRLFESEILEMLEKITLRRDELEQEEGKNV